MGKQKSKLELKKEYKKQYQAWKVLGLAGYVNERKEELAKKIIIKVASEYGFKASYLATIALSEGLGWSYLDLQSNYETTSPFGIRNDIPMSGFNALGTDDFGSEFSRYRKYLPNDFNQGNSAADFKKGAEFYPEKRINEKGDETISAVFKNMETAIWACGATLAHRRDAFERDRKNLGLPKPTEDQLAYWNYIYYQGEGNGVKFLREAKSLDIFKRNGCYPKCNVSARTRNANDVALSNLANWRYLQEFKIFDE